MATPLPFSGKQEETETFINSCHLYICTRILEFYDEQTKIYWILLFMQTGTAQVWQNIVSQQLYRQEIIYSMVEHFLDKINRKFGDTDKQTTASLKLRTMVQGDKHADEHVHDFGKVAMDTDYDGYPLIVEFKRFLNLAL